MKTKRSLAIGLIAMLFTVSALAGIRFRDSSSTLLGDVATIKCSTGLTCTKTGNEMAVVSSPTITGTSLSLSSTLAVTGATTLTGGVVNSGANTRFAPFPVAALTGVGTDTTPGATTVYVTPVFIPVNTTLTGIAYNTGSASNNGYTVMALFNAAGTPVANSTLTTGTATSASTNVWQQVAFTSPYAATGPAWYWVGAYFSSTSDRFVSIPAAGAFVGYAAAITGQTFLTVAAITPPTTFTAGKGPIIYTY